MTFRVISGNTPQNGNASGAATGKVKGLTIRPTPQSIRPRNAPAPGADITPLVERLETLSFTFEALNAGSRTYAAEAVLETLARMERRDLQALAAIEAFASALKTVGQHLAGLRHAVQSTAGDTAAAVEQIAARLDNLENRKPLISNNGAVSADLTGIADRLGRIETLLNVEDSRSDSELMSQLLTAMVQRVGDVDAKLDALPERINVPAVDLTPVNTQLESLGGQMARMERKIDESRAQDISVIRESIETIALRVSRIELSIDHTPGLQLPEPFDPAPILDVLQNINNRLKTIEERPESPASDLNQLTGFLGAIDQRLERMESGIGLPADEIPATTSAISPPAEQPVAPKAAEPTQEPMKPVPPEKAAAVASTLTRILARPAASAVAATAPTGIASPQAPAAPEPEQEPVTEKAQEPAAAIDESAPQTEQIAVEVPQSESLDEPAQPVAVQVVEEIAQPDVSAAEVSETPTEPTKDDAGDNRAKVDQLLEQVLRVLSR